MHTDAEKTNKLLVELGYGFEITQQSDIRGKVFTSKVIILDGKTLDLSTLPKDIDCSGAVFYHCRVLGDTSSSPAIKIDGQLVVNGDFFKEFSKYVHEYVHESDKFFKGHDLSEIDFRACAVDEEAMFERRYYGLSMKFEDCNFSGSNLNKLNLMRGHFIRTYFDDAKMSKCNLQEVCMIACSFENTDLSFANLEYANLLHSDLSTANLKGVQLRAALLSEDQRPFIESKIRETNTILSTIVFLGSEKTVVANRTIHNKLFRHIYLNNTKYQGVIFSTVTFDETAMDGACFEDSTFDFCRVFESSFTKTKFFGDFKITNTNFRDCTFSKSEFIDGTFDGVFIDVDFSHTYMGNMEIKNAHVERCNFTNAKFVDVKFVDCVFKDCDFSGATYSKSTSGLPESALAQMSML